MKCLRSVLTAAVCGAMALALVSCGDYVGKEKSNPVFAKGTNCKASGNYKDSAKYFEDFLLICPKSAKTHLELANLYNDNLDDPIQAIVHYQKYLDLSPVPPADAASVSQFIEAAKKKAYDKLGEEYKVTPEVVKLSKDVAEAKEKLAKYVDYAQKLKSQNVEMRQRLFGKASGKGLAAPAESSSKEKSAAPADSKSDKKKKADTYKTKAGDTVESIAKAVYGSASHANLIREANKSSVPAHGKFKAGVVLKIPALPPVAGDKAPVDSKSGSAAMPSSPEPSAAPAAGAKPQDDAEKLGVGLD